MKRFVVRKVGLVLIAMVFGVLSFLAPVKKTSATDELPWNKEISSNVYGCEILKHGIQFEGCPGFGIDTSAPISLDETDERYIDITMHSGDIGHFETEEGDVTEITVNYFRGDAFEEIIEPISDDPNYIFLGWSRSVDAEDIDVVVGETTASTVGSDIYAVWSDKAYVYYYVVNGVWSPEGSEDEYTEILMEYDANTNFQELTPKPKATENVYEFDGWYTGMFGGGEEYTSEKVINKSEVELFSKWIYNPENISNELELGEEYDITVGVSVPVYKFTPDETAYYEIYTDGIEDDGSGRQAMVRLQDINDHTLAIEKQIDPMVGKGNVHVYYEMEAGETYFVRFGEMDGAFMQYTVGVRKADMAEVTFHVNVDEGAWFDEDHESTIKTIELPIGDNIARYLESGLDYDDDRLWFIGWSSEQNPEDYHNTLLVDGAMDVYGFWNEYENFILDYNGGYDPLRGESVRSMVYKFQDGDLFETPIDPKINNSHLKFAGWSRNPLATEPDVTIVEDETLASEFRDETLYAVYTEKVLETFIVTDGGYMMDNPVITVYQTSSGKGHIFYGMAVRHDNPKMKAIGWTDQDGVMIDVVSEIDPAYHITKDTTYTVAWGYELTAFALEGSFEKTGAQVEKIRLPYENGDGTFSSQALIDAVGEPVPLGPNRYFIGWATDPDALEPDVIDGITPLEEIDEIFGIWGDEEYIIIEGNEASYEKGSEDELRIVVKREHDDRYTYDFFKELYIDGEKIAIENYEASSGSLVLLIHGDFLENLELGEHEVMISFQSSSMDVLELSTSLTVIQAGDEESEDIPATPDTGADTKQFGHGNEASFHLLAGAASMMIFIVIFRKTRR